MLQVVPLHPLILGSQTADVHDAPAFGRGQRLVQQPGEGEVRQVFARALIRCYGSDRLTSMDKPPRIFTTAFGGVYPLYVQKAERKGRTREEVDEIIAWLTGYSREHLQHVIDSKVDFQTFFARAPAMNPNVGLIKGVVCGVRVEDVADPLMQRIRYLDKLIDELAKGKKMASILRR